MKIPKTIQDQFLDTAEPGEMQSIADSILADFRPKKEDGSTIEKPNYFFVPMKSQNAKFRFPKNSGELRNIKVGIAEFVTRVQLWQAARDKDRSGKPDIDWQQLPDPFKDALSYRDLDADDLCNAFIIHFWSNPDQPGGKFTEPAALTMVAYEPFVVAGTVDRIYAIFSDWELATTWGGVFEKKTNLEPIGTTTSSD